MLWPSDLARDQRPWKWAKNGIGSAGPLVAREGRSIPKPPIEPSSRRSREASSVARRAAADRLLDSGLGAAAERRGDPRALAGRGTPLRTGGRARSGAGAGSRGRRAGGRGVVGEVWLRVHPTGSLHAEVGPRAVRPRPAASSGPLTFVVPFEPRIAALTIRGE